MSRFRAHLFARAEGFSEFSGSNLNLVVEGSLNVVDMSDLGTVKALYETAGGEGREDVTAAILKKAKVKTLDDLQPGKPWRTVRDLDQLLAGWLQAKGYNGWFMKLGYEEFMVVQGKVSSLKCAGVVDSKLRSKATVETG